MSSSIEMRCSHECRVFRPSVSGSVVHSVVPIRLSIPCHAGRQPNEGQPNESHENKPRTACTPLEPVVLQNLENVAVVATRSITACAVNGVREFRTSRKTSTHKCSFSAIQPCTYFCASCEFFVADTIRSGVVCESRVCRPQSAPEFTRETMKSAKSSEFFSEKQYPQRSLSKRVRLVSKRQTRTSRYGESLNRHT